MLIQTTLRPILIQIKTANPTLPIVIDGARTADVDTDRSDSDDDNDVEDEKDAFPLDADGD